jgi:hypothetical protein
LMKFFPGVLLQQGRKFPLALVAMCIHGRLQNVSDGGLSFDICSLYNYKYRYTVLSFFQKEC